MEFIPINKRPKVLNDIPESLVSDEERQEIRKDENPGKYYAMFERRAKKGQCFNQPYLGCREFSCDFKFIDSPEKVAEEFPAIPESRDLGFMLYDMDFEHPNSDGSINPAFFRATMENGIVNVPDWDSEEVRK
jgi:CRISPR-associated protein Cas5d